MTSSPSVTPAEPSPTPAADPAAVAAARVRQYFEALTPASLGAIGDVYAADARFVDPFNDVRGRAAIRRVFDHMFETLEAPRFVVSTVIAAGGEAFLTWDFHFRPRGAGSRAWCIHGATHVRFDPEGRVVLHRDYWDAAAELYAKLPVLGSLMRWLQRRLAAR